MATIIKRQRSDGARYQVVIRKNGRFLKARTFRRKADAREWAASIEGNPDKLAALGMPGGSLTLNTLAHRYLTEWTSHHKDTTGQSSRLLWWCDRLGCKRLAELTPALIRTTLDDLEGKAPATINRALAVLSSRRL